MGTFVGHVLPGSFFIAFALHWTARSFSRSFCATAAGGRKRFVSSASYPCGGGGGGRGRCCGGCSTNVEGVLKLAAAAVGMTGEIVTAFEDGKFAHLGNAQHATMFLAFGLTGVVDLFIHHRLAFFRRGHDYAAAALALTVEGALFAHHVHGQSQLELHLHRLLCYVIAANVAAVLVEAMCRHSEFAAFARCYFFMLQGTWFWQIAFVMYSPLRDHQWDPLSHDSLTLATLCFSWHAVADFAGLLIIGMVVFRVGKKRQDRSCYTELVSAPAADASADASAALIGCSGDDDDDASPPREREDLLGA